MRRHNQKKKPAKQKISRRHGMRNTSEWSSWQRMKVRCCNLSNKDYPYYGGRGIKVCDRWINGDGRRSGAQCFFADMGRKPTPAHNLDRKDNDKGYTPGNCRWATRLEQSRNRRNVKLNSRRVRAIRKSKATDKKLAKKYGCVPGAIWNARNGLTWREVRA